jgi:hypothetical protein
MVGVHGSKASFGMTLAKRFPETGHQRHQVLDGLQRETLETLANMHMQATGLVDENRKAFDNIKHPADLVE